MPPDEIWSRNFMSRGIGPAGMETLAALAPAAHLHSLAPDLSSLRAAQQGAEFVRKPDLGLPPRPGSMGAPMGITMRPEAPVRRSWLARLFGRS